MNVNEIGKIYERPWGTYKTLELGNGYQVKVITVNPKGKLSLQKHAKRAEHWVVIQGKLNITVDADIKSYDIGEHVYIPIGAAHRMENSTNHPAAIIEVQVGSYLGEDDIMRLDDIYGRS